MKFLIFRPDLRCSQIVPLKIGPNPNGAKIVQKTDKLLALLTTAKVVSVFGVWHLKSCFWPWQTFGHFCQEFYGDCYGVGDDDREKCINETISHFCVVIMEEVMMIERSALPSNLRQVLAHDGPICPGTQLPSAIVIIIIKKII